MSDHLIVEVHPNFTYNKQRPNSKEGSKIRISSSVKSLPRPSNTIRLLQIQFFNTTIVAHIMCITNVFLLLRQKLPHQCHLLLLWKSPRQLMLSNVGSNALHRDMSHLFGNPCIYSRSGNFSLCDQSMASWTRRVSYILKACSLFQAISMINVPTN